MIEWHEVSVKHIRHWTFDFIRGFGVFTNHSYKNRVPSGIIRDPAARDTMIRWMLTASKAKPPAAATDFMGFVNTDCYKDGVIGHKITAAYQKNTIIGENHELIGVLKGVKQVLEERRMNYSKAPGEATCKQVKIGNNANAERKRLLAEWEQDKESQVKRLLFLTYPKQEDVVHQSKAVHQSKVQNPRFVWERIVASLDCGNLTYVQKKNLNNRVYAKTKKEDSKRSFERIVRRSFQFTGSLKLPIYWKLPK